MPSRSVQLQLPGVPFDYGRHTLWPCPSYPGIAVDDLGGVWTSRTTKARSKACKGWHKLREHTSRGNRSRGYKRVSIKIGNSKRPIEIHALVADAFLGPRPYGHIIHHKDEDNWNNHHSNLEYMTEDNHRLHHANIMTTEDWESII